MQTPTPEDQDLFNDDTIFYFILAQPIKNQEKQLENQFTKK